jgi:hypothetical protein
MLEIIGPVCQNCKFYSHIFHESSRSVEFICTLHKDFLNINFKKPCKDWKEIPTPEHIMITNT